MNGRVRVLFICVDNASRSRMAEALLRDVGGDRFDVTSAGFDPQRADLLVVEALAREGLELAVTQRQPSVFELYRSGRHFHYVISVCDEEHGEKCPLFPGVTRRLSWSFPDPRTFEGNRAEQVDRAVVRVPDHVDHRFRSKPITDSGRKPITDSGPMPIADSGACRSLNG